MLRFRSIAVLTRFLESRAFIAQDQARNNVPNGHPKENPASIVFIPFHRDGIKRQKDIGDDRLDRLLAGDEGGGGHPSGAAHCHMI